MIKTNVNSFLLDLESGRKIKIKIFILGGGFGDDFIFYSLFYSIKKFFPNVILDYRRVNTAEMNCFNIDNYKGRVKLPLDSLELLSLHQTDGWEVKIYDNKFDHFPAEFLDTTGYDYVWSHGATGSSSQWLNHFGNSIIIINEAIVANALRLYNFKTKKVIVNEPIINIPDNWGAKKVKSWFYNPQPCEYLCYKDIGFPFEFTEEFKNTTYGKDYKDYMSISLRWPDYIRWYYTLDQQYEVLFSVINKIKEKGKKVKLIYNLKDGSINNNHWNLGQTLERLKLVMDTVDDIIFTYSNVACRRNEIPTEEEELNKLKNYGIKNIKCVDFWEGLLLTTNAKVKFYEPAGYLEVLSLFCKDDSLFSMPTSIEPALLSYVVANEQLLPIKIKTNNIIFEQCYKRSQIEPQLLRIEYKGKIAHVKGDNAHFFDKLQEPIYTELYNDTKDTLINSIVNKYIE